MHAPSKPVLIALAGVAGLAVVIGGVLFLRYRASPDQGESYSSPMTTNSTSQDATSSTDMLSGQITTSTEIEFPDGKGAEIPSDADGDGLSDSEESRAGTSAILRDTDGDGITDYEEIRIYQTDPLLFGIPNAPTQPIETPVIEIVTPPPPPLDSDSDGLTDEDEVKYQTSPTNRDSDNDTFPDGEEIQKGYNPRGPGKCATSTCLP
jgi:hypothetical protein